MQLISNAKTPKEARKELVTLIRKEAVNERKTAYFTKRKEGQAIHIARAQALESLAELIDSIQDGVN